MTKHINSHGDTVGSNLQDMPSDVWERAGDDAILYSLRDRPVNPKFLRWVENNKAYLLRGLHSV